MVKVVIVFCICSLINVILSTLKTLIMSKTDSCISSILINSVCYGFYALVVKQMNAVDYVSVVVITVLANAIGVWISYKIMNFFKKDKLWRITVTLKNGEELKECITQLEQYNIGFTQIKDCFSIDIYSYSQSESSIIKSILANYKHKYFVQEMGNKL